MLTVLITGASSGFGAALARRLAADGHRVFGTFCSTTAGHPGVEMLPLDVTDDVSVADCVREVLARAGTIDVLVNNAGYVHEGAIEEVPIAELRAVFDTSVFGAVRMVQAVLPSMRLRRRGRIVNVSSVAGLMPIPFWGAYCAAKHALESVSESLRYELSPLGIDVVLVEPAFYRTAIASRKRRSSGQAAGYDPCRARMLEAVAREEGRAPDPEPVVALLHRLVTTPRRPRLRHVIGKYTLDYWLRGVVPWRAWEWGLRRRWGLD